VVEGYLDYLQKAQQQRKRAGEIKTNDDVSQAKRDFLLKMAERNETMAEVQMRKDAGQPTAPATSAIKLIDAELVAIKDRLDKLGISVKRKR